MIHNQSINQIIHSCKKNDAKAQRSLFDRFYENGMRIAIRYSSSTQDAEEILSNSFVRVYQKIELFDDTYPFMGWFRTIIIRASSDYYRNVKKVHFKEMEDLDIIDTDSHDIISELSYEEILNKVQQLPPAYRLVFNMFEIDGLKHREIADHLGITSGTSKSNLFKAKKILKMLLTTEKV